MSGGFSNKPKILRGAFVEAGLSIPPLFVVFQLNPEQLNRARSLNFSLVTKLSLVMPASQARLGERSRSRAW